MTRIYLDQILTRRTQQEAEKRVFMQPASYLGPRLVFKRRVGYALEGQDLPRKMMRLTLTDIPKVYKFGSLAIDEVEVKAWQLTVYNFRQ